MTGISSSDINLLSASRKFWDIICPSADLQSGPCMRPEKIQTDLSRAILQLLEDKHTTRSLRLHCHCLNAIRTLFRSLHLHCASLALLLVLKDVRGTIAEHLGTDLTMTKSPLFTMRPSSCP